jgi:hypothetical protein
MSGNAFAVLQYSNTPALLRLRAMAPYGGKPKPGTLGSDSLFRISINVSEFLQLIGNIVLFMAIFL